MSAFQTIMLIVLVTTSVQRIAGVKSKVKVRTPLVVRGDDFVVKCFIQLKRLPNNTDKIDVVFTLHEDKHFNKCAVAFRKTCPRKPFDGIHGSHMRCGCLSHDASSFKYIFFLHVKHATTSMQDAVVECLLKIANTVKRHDEQMKMIDFSRWPPLFNYICIGNQSSLKFPWDLDRRQFDGLLTIKYIRWMFQSSATSIYHIGTYDFKAKNFLTNKQYAPRVSLDMPRGEQTIPQLRLGPMSKHDHGKYQIQVHFLVTKLFLQKFGTEVFRPERKKILTGTVMFDLSEPPKNGSRIKFVTVNLKDGVSVRCSIQNYESDFSGNPSVNITIQKQKKVIKTSPLGDYLQVKVPAGSPIMNYTCKLDGVALACVNEPNSSVLKIVDIVQVPVNPVSWPDSNYLSPFTIIHALEGVMCMWLMLWNVKLIIAHLSTIAHKQRMKAENKVKERVERWGPKLAARLQKKERLIMEEGEAESTMVDSSV